MSQVNPKYIEEKNGQGFGERSNDDSILLFDKKVSSAVEGLEPIFDKILRQKIPKGNALYISEFINSSKREINISNGYRAVIVYTLANLSRFHSNKKDFREMIREDILLYLDSFRRPESLDPLHKWIGTYNLKGIIVVKFFKWLYYPDIEPEKRPNPKVVENIARLKRKELVCSVITNQVTNSLNPSVFCYLRTRATTGYNTKAVR